MQSRPRLSDGASTAQSAAPRHPRPAGGGLSHRDPGTDREPLPSGSRLHRVPGRGTGSRRTAPPWTDPRAPSGAGRHGGMGASDRPPAPARPPRPDPRKKRPPCWWPGQHRVGLGAPRTPFPGTERSPPWGCPSVPPAAALPASAGPLLNSQPATPLLQRRPLTRRFSGSGSLPQVSDTSCAKGLVSIPVCPPPPPLLELTPAYCTPTPRRTREASKARRKTA